MGVTRESLVKAEAVKQIAALGDHLLIVNPYVAAPSKQIHVGA